MNRRDFLRIGALLLGGAYLLRNGCHSTQLNYTDGEAHLRETEISYNPKQPENPYVPRVFGHQLTQKELNQMRKLHNVTWTWEAGKWTAFPSGNYSQHNNLVPDLPEYDGPKTYKEAGWILDDLQNMLLVDFRAYGRNVTQDTLNAGLMLPCAIALHKISKEIGTLNTLDPNYPRITLIEAIERAYDADTPRKCFRSSFQQLEAYNNTTGEDYTPENHSKHAGYIARPGRGPHGTGNALDVPMFLHNDPILTKIFEKHGFRKRLPESDPVHFEYVDPRTYVDFPRPGDVDRYVKVYPRLKGAKL